ncbi:hypothetical protein D3C72_1993950 [compost metagenome]
MTTSASTGPESGGVTGAAGAVFSHRPWERGSFSIGLSFRVVVGDGRKDVSFAVAGGRGWLLRSGSAKGVFARIIPKRKVLRNLEDESNPFQR